MAKAYDSLNPTSEFSTGLVTFGSRSNIPTDAVMLSREAALKHQLELYAKWRPKRDVWPITHGATLSGIAAAFSGAMLNAMFRKHYVLRRIGIVATTMPNVFLPGALAYITGSLCMHDIILMDTKCVVCTQAKAMAYQVGFGVIYPCIMAPMSCLMIAARCLTYPVPPLTTHYKDILADIRRIFGKRSSTLAGLTALQFIVSFGLLHMQMKSVFKVHRKLAE
uniref:Transmembrane protein 126A n=1 Tax=Rhipicephalus appendiculatus TaxID=34631 RepID=A0A131YZV7_RHIAP